MEQVKKIEVSLLSEFKNHPFQVNKDVEFYELERGVRTANVFLSVGLPLSKYGAEKQEFISYLSKNKEISFKYEGAKYNVRIVKVAVFPQCYAAVADKLSERKREQLVIDIGSWTFDCLNIKDMLPQNGQSISKEIGLITCMNQINEECSKQLTGEIVESDIQHIMRTGQSELPEKYTKIVVDRLKSFTREVYDTLKEEKYNLELTPVTFVGGGTKVMELFSDVKKDTEFVSMPSYRTNQVDKDGRDNLT